LEDGTPRKDSDETNGREGKNKATFHVTDEERMRIKSELFKGLGSSHTGANPNNPAR